MKISLFRVDLICQVNIFFISTELTSQMAKHRNEQALKAFGENLKKLREAKGLTTREFADMAEIAYSQVWRLESGQGDPTLSTLLAISKALDIKIELLIPANF